MAWPSNAKAPHGMSRPWALSLALVALLIACMAVPALAAPDNEANTERLDKTVRFLESAQNSDGGFRPSADAGEASNPLLTAWVSIALATAGVNPQSQSQPEGASAYTYLSEHTGELSETTAFERVLMVVDAAGAPPQSFGGVNLIQAILHRKLPGGGFAHVEGDDTPGVNDTIFAIIALSPDSEADVQEAIGGAVKWLEQAQSPTDGSWPLSPGAEGNVDITAAAVEALNAAGVHNSEAQRKAFEYLHGAQDPDGGFPEYTTESAESDSASTSWTVQAIWSAGGNPETWKQQSSGKEPLDYLESLQRENGSVQWKAGSDEQPVWMTAYAGPAFAGEALPPPAVPLAIPSASTPPAAGTGVTAGGGGDGAPLFSRPQPQSLGDTPGGARQLHASRGHAGKQASRRPREPDLRPTADALTIAASGASQASSSSPHAQSKSRARVAPTSHAGAGKSSSGSGGAVTGLVINASDDTPAVQAGAPGLRSAGADENPTQWLAIALAGLIVTLILVGSLLERRRPEVIL
jgi:hypothetical protein